MVESLMTPTAPDTTAFPARKRTTFSKQVASPSRMSGTKILPAHQQRRQNLSFYYEDLAALGRVLGFWEAN